MKQRVAIYPFDHEFLPLVRNNPQEDLWQFTHLISPAGWGFTGKDAGELDQDSEVGITISDNFEEALHYVDTVIFTQSINAIDKEKDILPKLEMAIKNKKNISCTVSLSSEEYGYYQSMCASEGCSFSYHNNNLFNKDEMKGFLQQDLVLHDVSSSVVMVFGITNNMGKLDSQFALQEFFKKQGYKTSLVSSKSYGSFFNAHPSPGFLFSNDFTESEKVVLFNQYIKHIERMEKPDVIIIGVPGGLLPLKKQDTVNFGILPFIITRGAQPDASIVCTYAERYSKRYFEELTPTLDNRFSMGLVGYLINNITIDFSLTSPSDLPRFIHINEELVSRRIPDEVKDVVFSKGEQEQLFTQLLTKLHDYGEVEAF